MEEINIDRVEKIDVENGDVLAVFVERPVPPELLEESKRKIEDAFLPKKVRVVILNAALVEMKVLRAK
jgi:hypothetical protein